MTSILDAAVKSNVAGKNPGAYDGGGKKGGLGTPLSEEEKKKKWVTHPITKTNSFVTLEREWDEDTDEEGGVKDDNLATGTKMVDDDDEDVANNTTRGVSTDIMSGLVEVKERNNTAEGAFTDGTTDERNIERKSNDSVADTKADANANDVLKPSLVSEHWRECLPLIPLATRFEPRSDDHVTMCTTVMHRDFELAAHYAKFIPRHTWCIKHKSRKHTFFINLFYLRTFSKKKEGICKKSSPFLKCFLTRQFYEFSFLCCSF